MTLGSSLGDVSLVRPPTLRGASACGGEAGKGMNQTMCNMWQTESLKFWELVLMKLREEQPKTLGVYSKSRQ